MGSDAGRKGRDKEVPVLHMRRHGWWQWLIFAVLLAETAVASNGVRVGDRAPDFSLYDLDSRVRKLSDFSSTVVVLYFFGHNAGICVEFAGVLQEIHNRYRGDGATVIGVDCWDGTMDQVRYFRDTSGADYTLLLDGSSVARNYDLSYNSTLVLNRRGIIRYLAPGPDESAFDPNAIESAIVAALEEQEADVETTWGTIKSLYERSKAAVFMALRSQ